MKLNLLCTQQGLVPMYDEDYDLKKRLKVGQSYVADVKVARNVGFHRKYWALLNAAWSLLPERTSNGFRSLEGFRSYVIVAAGFYELYFNPRLKEFVEVPRSISFEKMDEVEFSELYNRSKDVIWSIVGRYVSEEDFERCLINF